jgi:hypothetical protein
MSFDENNAELETLADNIGSARIAPTHLNRYHEFNAYDAYHATLENMHRWWNKMEVVADHVMNYLVYKRPAVKNRVFTFPVFLKKYNK